MRDADRSSSLPGCGARATSEWCAGRRRLPADEWHSYGARPPRTTHDLHSTKICYRFHPLYGVEVDVVRHLRRIGSAVLIVRLPGGAHVALPEWMLSPQACDRLSHEERPRIAIHALLDLRGLIDAQHIKNASRDDSCAESPSGGQDAQQRSDRSAAQTALRGGRDLERASEHDARTMPNSVAPTAGERSQNECREAE